MQLLQFSLLAGRGFHQSLHTHECDAYSGVRRIEREAGDTGIEALERIRQLMFWTDPITRCWVCSILAAAL